MQKGIGNFAFALFAALLLVGSAFAAVMTNSTAVAANSAPVITSVGGPTSLSAGTEGTWSVSAYDPDGNYLSYAVSWGDNLDQRQAGQSASTSTATFQHTYSAAGTYTITFTVTDSNGEQTTSTITTTVTGTSKNHPPSFSSVSCPVTAKSATCYVYANDPDGDPVTYTINFGDSTGTVSGMQNVFAHTYQMAGTYAISIKAADKYGATATTSLKVTVTGNENQKPIISSVSGPSSLSVNQAGTWKVSAYDPEGTTVTYSVNWGESGVTASDSLGRTGTSTSFEHAYSKSGTYTITFTASDAQGATAQSTSTVVVDNSVAIKCTDSDGGSNLYVKGTTSGYAVGTTKYMTAIDYCKSNSELVEYFCNEQYTNASGQAGVNYNIQTCFNGCSNGACKASGKGLEIASVWVAPDKYNANSSIFYVNLLDNGNVATGNDIEARYNIATPHGNWSGALSLGDNNNPYITMGIGYGDGCGTYPYTVTARRISASGTGSGNYAEKSGTFTLSPPYCKQTAEKITLKLVPGWNQISVPTMNLEVSDLAKKCDISQTVWYYNAASKQYATATSLGGGHVGYWVKANSACEYTLDSTYVTPAPGAFNLKAGWNMIGSPLKATAVADFAGNCKITSGAWHYSQVATSGQATNGEYVYSSTLEPGNGYWVKVSADCTMQSAVDSPPPAPID